MDESLKFGGGATESLLNPVVLIAIIVASALVLFLPRKHAVIPFLLCIFLVPTGEQLVIGGFHLFVFRVLIAAGWVRVLTEKCKTHRSVLSGGWSPVDSAFFAWAIFHSLAFVFLYPKNSAVINQAGFLWDALGGFYFLRAMIREERDVRCSVRAFAVLAIVLGGCMLNEKVNNHNLFGFLGGVPLVPTVRNGSIRAQATFAHALLAGTFGATLLPLLLWLWKDGRAKVVAMLGMAGSVAMALASSSSTGAMAALGGIIGFWFWPLRFRMRLVRWGIVLGLIALQLVMKAPVWFVIDHINITGSSSSYHRAYLVDTFIRHVGDWWVIGTKDNGSWGFDTWDITNQYVAEGVNGGLGTFVFFLLVISLSFGRVGRAIRAARGNRPEEWFLWLLGVTLFSHVVAFFGISYFDQTRVAWYALLAMICAATAPFMKSRARGAGTGVVESDELQLADTSLSARDVTA